MLLYLQQCFTKRLFVFALRAPSLLICSVLYIMLYRVGNPKLCVVTPLAYSTNWVIKLSEFQIFDFPVKVINLECCWIFDGTLLHETWFNGPLIGVGLDKVGTTQSEDIGSICHRHQQWPRGGLSWAVWEEGGKTKPRSGDSHGYSRQQKWDRVSQGSGHFYNIQNRCLE